MQLKTNNAPMSEWNLPKRFKSESGQVAYNVIGEGPPVVLVHGTPSWSYLWRNVAERLMSDYSVYVYDLVGYGCSERSGSQDVSIRNQAKILRQLLRYWHHQYHDLQYTQLYPAVASNLKAVVESWLDF